jgi:CDP-diacylglycerol--glycerol-3-phosphate 3-phosphatidyltransferase
MAERHHAARTRALGAALALLAAASLAAALHPLLPAGRSRWLHPATVAGLCWAGQLWYVAHAADARPAGLLRDALGPANLLTLLRGGLYAAVAGFAVAPSGMLAWGPAACYGAGVLLDKLDGTVARTVGEETELGADLDMAFDTFGFVAAPLVAVLWGLLPVWYLSLSAARYVFLAGLRWRRFRGRPVYDLPDSDLGRYLAAVQMAFLAVALAPPAPSDLVWAAAPVVLAPSLLVFARDFLVASGRLADPTA